jgi:hypothetical protein
VNGHGKQSSITDRQPDVDLISEKREAVALSDFSQGIVKDLAD